ncbi:unnamed protein product, partial [marine sediment metagenome]
EVSLGAGKIEVTNDPAKAATADRTVEIKDDMGTWTRKDGSTGYCYGEWDPRESKICRVHLDNFTDRHGDDYKSGDPPQWDLDKLADGIGRTAAHEVGHSYSAGHRDDPNDLSKMTEGSLVDSETRANTEWVFHYSTDDVLEENLGKPPCDANDFNDVDIDFLQPYPYQFHDIRHTTYDIRDISTHQSTTHRPPP